LIEGIAVSPHTVRGASQPRLSYLTLHLLGAADILRGVVGSIMKAPEDKAYAAQVKNLIQEHLARS
jgi:hypothetical protein